jgi:hypothetical protein
MPLTTLGKNTGLTAIASAATHVGAFQAGTALTSVTGATPSTFTKSAHGMANNTLVLVSALSGGTSLVAGRPYFVINQATNTFQLALTPGGAAVDMGTTVTSATVTPYTEITYHTSGTRATQSWNTAAGGAIDNNVVGASLNIPSGATVNALGAFSASTAGNLLDFATVTAEGPYGANGAYDVSDYDIDLNAAG